MPACYTLFVTTSATAVREITVKSPAFMHKGKIPAKYTADGANINPPLILGKIPEETKSMVLMVEDPKAPVDTWVHWVVWNIPPCTKIEEGSKPGIEGINAFRLHHYHGPSPPGDTRAYFFKVYTLDTLLQLHESSTKYEVTNAMKDHVIGYGELMGPYSHEQKTGQLGYTPPSVFY